MTPEMKAPGLSGFTCKLCRRDMAVCTGSRACEGRQQLYRRPLWLYWTLQAVILVLAVATLCVGIAAYLVVTL